MFEPKNSDYWHYKYTDSMEREFCVDRFRGDSNGLIAYLLSDRNMSVDEARMFQRKIKSVSGK